MSGGIPGGFALVLSRLIFFVNNLKDDTEANFIQKEDTKTEETVNTCE